MINAKTKKKQSNNIIKSGRSLEIEITGLNHVVVEDGL